MSFNLDRTERDLVTRVHRWAKANGWAYDATTLDHSLTDYRWRGPEYTVVIRLDHTWPVPWTVEVDGPALQNLNADCASVGQSVNVLAAFGVLPATLLALPPTGRCGESGPQAGYDPADCNNAWHFQHEEPADECPQCRVNAQGHIAPNAGSAS